MSAPIDAYAVLGVPPDADAARIRAAYLALMQQHHPDRVSGDSGASEERTKEINAAFAVLGDPQKRAAYDQSRRAPAVAAGPPAARRASRADLERAASRRTRALARGAAVTAGALVALGAVVASRASGHPPIFSFDRFDRPPAVADPLPGGDAPLGVMLPWPEAGRVQATAGLKLVFAEGAAPGLTVGDAAGRTAFLALPAGTELESARYGVGRLDPESPGAAVVVAFRKAGETCCSHVRVASRTVDGWRIADLGMTPAPPLELFPTELDGDGVPEFVLPDPRFRSAFGPPQQALFPPRMLQIRDGRVVDVSDSGRFHTTFRQEMESARPICALGSNSGCAAFVANAARAGRLQWAWAVMLESYDRRATWPLPTGCAAPAASGACPADQVRRFRSYPAALADFLRRTGYVRETPLDLGEVTPRPAPVAESRPRATTGRPGSG